MHRVDVSTAEKQFRTHVEQWYVSQGVGPDSVLFDHWVHVTGPGNFCAGERIVRELSTFGPLRDKRVLDVGCGVGGALVALCRVGACCVGIDIDRDRLDLARERLELHGCEALTVCGSAFSLPFPDGAFDVVLCSDMLEHVKDRPRLIAEFARVLRPGGLLYLAFPNLLSLRNVLSDPHYHLFGVVLLPLPLARWYTRKRRGRNYDVEVLPLSPGIARLCARHGITVHDLTSSERVLLDKLQNPATVRNRAARVAISLVRGLGLRVLAKSAVRLRAMTQANAVLAGIKS